MTSAPEFTDLCELARELAVEAGALAEHMRADIDLAGETKSSATDIVTEADKATERVIVDGLLARRPDDGLLGEEGAGRSGTSGVRWVIDPIDGTTNYVYGLPGFAVSIAAEWHGDLVVGVVHEPRSGRTYHAVRGAGASVDDRPIRVSTTAEPEAALVGTGFGYRPERRLAQAEVLVQVLPRIRDIRRAGSAALDLCMVAEGRLDAYFERGLNRWDFGAGVVIAAEAGARVENLRGGAPDEQFALAANPYVFEAMAGLLRAAAADRTP